MQNISAYLALELLINGWIHVPVSRHGMYRFLAVGCIGFSLGNNFTTLGQCIEGAVKRFSKTLEMMPTLHDFLVHWTYEAYHHSRSVASS